MTIESFNTFAAEHPEAVASFIEQGKKAGVAEGTRQERDRVVGVLKAYGLPDGNAALASVVNGDDAELAKRIADVAAKSRAESEAAAASAAAAHKAEAERLAKELERAKFEASGQGPVGGAAKASAEAKISDNPKAQAEQEWDSDPAVREGFTSKENYVAFREADLKGAHRSFGRRA